MQRLVAIAWLTWKAAFSFRLFLVLAVLLGLCTLWLSCGTLARDIEECQVQMVAVKPVARWQIWVGKWLGIVSLNAALLALAGAGVYGVLLWRATKLPPNEQAILRNEILVARGSAREKNVETDIEADTERAFQQSLEQNPSAKDLPEDQKKEARKQIRERIKAEYQVVPPGTYREWNLDVGAGHYDQPLQLRVKFNSAAKSQTGTFAAFWRIGVPPKLIDEHGMLTVVFANFNDTALLFPLEDGIEVLYRQGGFAANFARGLGLILCWMALLAALGLAAASFLSFPVAAFCSLGLLILGTSAGSVLKQLGEGTAAEKNGLYQFVVQTLDHYQKFSPIEPLSMGRSIEWSELGQAIFLITILLGGTIALVGIFIFNRRELATAQGNR